MSTTTPTPSLTGPVFGEFIRTFAFSQSRQLPIVQPGGSLVFPNTTLPPRGVTYVDNGIQTGLLVPAGVYLVAVTLNLGIGASVSVLVNGIVPTADNGYQYGTTIVNSEAPIDKQFFVRASLSTNLVSLVNSGDTLFTLNEIPNTRSGNTALITQVCVTLLSDA